jgi:hypothetical protein
MSIQVAARIRPLLKSELKNGEQVMWQVIVQEKKN